MKKNLISEYRNGGKCYNILDGGLAAVVDTSKKVYQYTLEGKFLKEWTSATEAAKFYKVTQSTITNCCNPNYRTKTACGFIFSYNKTSKKDPIISVSTKAVNQYDLHMNLMKGFFKLRSPLYGAIGAHPQAAELADKLYIQFKEKNYI